MFGAKRLPDVLAGLFIGLVVLFVAFPMESFSGSIPGHVLGLFGTIMMSAALIYPFRKRILKKKGNQNPLVPHVYFGLVGANLVVIHSGHKQTSTVGILIFVAMLLVVLSGIVGKMLYAKVNRTLRGHKADLGILTQSFRNRKQISGLGFDACRLVFEREKSMAWADENEADIYGETAATDERAKCQLLGQLAEAMADKEGSIQVFTRTQKYFSFWSIVHVFSTYFLFSMIGVHVMTNVYYGLSWLP